MFSHLIGWQCEKFWIPKKVLVTIFGPGLIIIIIIVAVNSPS
jgi:hypothetical protein